MSQPWQSTEPEPVRYVLGIRSSTSTERGILKLVLMVSVSIFRKPTASIRNPFTVDDNASWDGK